MHSCHILGGSVKSASMRLWRKPPNTTRLINMSPCENTSAPISLLQTSVDFPNGMLLIPLFLMFLHLMMASLDMAGVKCYSSTVDWIQNYCLDTLCLPNLNSLTPFMISSMSMALCLDSNPTMQIRNLFRHERYLLDVPEPRLAI